ncbi:fungal-specific transcription factor domain-containing protein [Peziza echinospora]|nr:fungal-specific transcription factor domain-containing protein [Peziza echinospora]
MSAEPSMGDDGNGSNSGGEEASPTNSTSQLNAPNTGANAVSNSQSAAQLSFRRKVRCDAASLGVPCTNCQAFQIECKIPTPKRKKVAAAKTGEREETMHRRGSTQGPSPSPGFPTTSFNHSRPSPVTTTQHSHSDAALSVILPDGQPTRPSADADIHFQFAKPKFARAPIKEAGRVAYLGESSNFGLLVRDSHGASETVHYPLPDSIRGSRSRLAELDELEIDILHQRGAFLLPPRALCDELVEAYFKWIAPVVPVINRSRFMRQYRDQKNPPSLLLLQSILLAGSRVCTNSQLMDANGSTTPAAMTFYKRAKALYDANYEDDRVTIVQSLVLMGWYWEGPEDVTKNVFYWSRVATIVAQGSGMHRSVEHSQLSQADKRLWKRIWWTLFTRDRQVAVALGRPVHINTDDSDVPMVTEDDFIDDEPGYPAEYPADPLHVQYFLHQVKLCEIMGLVLSQQYSVASKAKPQNAIDLVHSDLALADWMLHVPPEMRYHVEDKSRQNFLAALLHSTYYTTLCLLHRAHMPPTIPNHGPSPDENSYPSRNIAFRAAAAITSIIDNLMEHDELKFCPAFTVYSLFSALIMHVYQMRSTNPQVVSDTQKRMKKCMHALKEISKVWIVARMVYTLFESIIGNKALEERLQKTTNRRHHRKGQINAAVAAQHADHRLTDPVKRKFDEMDIGGMPNAPVQNLSYERSRPQTPAPTPAMNMGAPNMNSQQRNGDTTMGGHGPMKPNTRPPTPFQILSIPPTPNPPDLFLVTRSSPPISQSLWENFQPHQLFPEDSGMNQFSPGANSMDSHLPESNLTQSAMNLHLQMQRGNSGGEFDLGPGPAAGSSPDDTWSNSSRGGVVPTMLNVEDWFNFFGLNGDLSAIAADGAI